MIVSRAQSDLDLWASPSPNLWHTRCETFLNEVSATITTISLVSSKHFTILCFLQKAYFVIFYQCVEGNFRESTRDNYKAWL